MSPRANSISASAADNMIIAWKNLYNVGQNVVISNYALEFSIVYITFFFTGTSGVIGSAGQLNIGKKEAKMALWHMSVEGSTKISWSVTHGLE
jgi:hypothetical protein